MDEVSNSTLLKYWRTTKPTYIKLLNYIETKKASDSRLEIAQSVIPVFYASRYADQVYRAICLKDECIQLLKTRAAIHIQLEILNHIEKLISPTDRNGRERQA
jgi:hypothetical protein